MFRSIPYRIGRKIGITYLEYAFATRGFRSLFLIYEKSFSTGAILKEYGAKNITGKPRSSYICRLSFALWMEALSRSRVDVLRQLITLASRALHSPAKK
jgi:hypothetical protein